MPMNLDAIVLEPGHLEERIEQAILNAVRGEREIVLDLAAVDRLDAGALKAIQRLAEVAKARGIKPVLRGARVETYKVLKLLDLANSLTYEATSK